ncbi:hypothetical protein H1S01_19725 [Heliobacterium chlorum]|uniref:Uncharacterized protein n=1 Tax=Heliobacterium chlorum TaxID=2698 RepID=A0ABR7T7D0_HELCL|nr:hypothetical protein [Heliobacterium chlorum]MBC9786674.1 hypothetical protein [Heliobacterium chlorum]
MSSIVHDRYRMDNRTVEQFAEDIHYGAKVERKIIDAYVAHYEKKYGERLSIMDSGCDNSGKLLSRKNVSTKADYQLNGKPVEVKFNNEWLFRFRLKEDQLNSYIAQNASILWLNGYQTAKPQFTVMKTSHLEDIQTTKNTIAFIPWGGKKCYELEADDYIWTKLEVAKIEKPHRLSAVTQDARSGSTNVCDLHQQRSQKREGRRAAENQRANVA